MPFALRAVAIVLRAVAMMSFVLASPVLASSRLDGGEEASPDSPETPPLVQDFDWLSAWGSVDTLGHDDFVIPSSQLPVKADIKALLKSCISDKGKMNQAQLKAYLVDFNGDGINDILLDGHAFYRDYAEDSPSCGAPLCAAEEGCLVSLYAVGEAHQLPTNPQPAGSGPAESSPPGSGPPESAGHNAEDGRQGDLAPSPEQAEQARTQSCPEDPEDNARCKAGCPATESLCPASFSYDMRKVWNGRAKSATFIAADAFSGLVQGQTAYATRNAFPVLVIEYGGKDMALCAADELAAQGGRCVKYYQFIGDMAQGAFADLRAPAPPPLP